MGNDEIKKNENNKINMNEIIENDCYEEVNINKINKILEQEKKWNKNSIIYSIKDLNFLDIEEDKKKFENDNKSDKEKSNEKLFNRITEQKVEIENGQDKEQGQNQNIQSIENNNNNNSNENKKNKEIEENGENDDRKKEEIIEINNSKKEKGNDIVIGNNNNIEVEHKEKEGELNQNNKVTDVNNSKKDISKEKQKIQPMPNKGAEKEKTKNNLKVNKNKQKLTNELFDIKNIIPEYRLNHLKDDDIIYSDTIEKITKIPGKENKITYSERFCIVTKNYFAYYKSKESYISLNKPLLLINNNNIKRIENTSFGDNAYYFGIILEVNDETKYLVDKVNSFVTNEDNSYELLLGFRTKEFNEMIKWVIILTYFTSETNAEGN